MKIFAPWAVFVVALVCGFIIGLVSGFIYAALAARSGSDAIAPRNRFLKFMTQPTDTMTSAQTIAVFAVVTTWLIVFVALCVAPLMVADQFEVNSSVLFVAYVAALGTLWLGRVFGKRLWWQAS